MIRRSIPADALLPVTFHQAAGIVEVSYRQTQHWDSIRLAIATREPGPTRRPIGYQLIELVRMDIAATGLRAGMSTVMVQAALDRRRIDRKLVNTIAVANDLSAGDPVYWILLEDPKAAGASRWSWNFGVAADLMRVAVAFPGRVVISYDLSARLRWIVDQAETVNHAKPLVQEAV